MRHVPTGRSVARCARFECFEDRLLLSGACPARGPDLVTPLPDWGVVAPATAGSTSPANASYVRDTYGFRGTGQTVAVIDSGIAYDHVALGGGLGPDNRVVGGWDFTEENDADPYDDGPAGFHGTHVAGIIAGRDADRPGIAPSVDLVSLRVFNDQGLGYVSWVEQALAWVHTHRNDYRYPITTVNLSLGSAWNGSAPPEWATLEDELATLEQDGMWVVVAAGNSFSEYGVPGLMYPAASPHVIAASSVDSEGRLSDFSQRLDRALAAPGENIVSTVPDHVFGADGVPDDWASASGTSMAAPYVAGAGVLVREALQYAGQSTVGQGDIYRWLRDSSDPTYDPITDATYHRLNVGRAIDQIMPADDYGSTAADSWDLGTLGDRQVVSGRLARLDDVDFFEFTAGTSGELTAAVSADAPLDVMLATEDGSVLPPIEGAHWQVDAGTTYRLSLAARQNLARYELQLSLKGSRSVRVDGHHVIVTGTPDDDLVEFIVDSQIRLTINGELHTFERGPSWRFDVQGLGGDNRLKLHGSASSEEVILRPGQVEFSGPGYRFSAGDFSRIMAIAGRGEDDVARLHGTAGNDLFVADSGQATLSGSGYRNQAIGFDRVYAHAVSGADDVARFHDSPGNDEFAARPDSSVMRGSGYYNKAIGFDRVYAYASSGNDDVARFFDSDGNDVFAAEPRAASLSGNGYYNKAMQFDRVYAYASSGADDVAHLSGSAGNDLFVGKAEAGYLRGDGYFSKALRFDRVYADAGTGVDDVARLYDSAGNDLFVGGPRAGVLRGRGYYNKAMNFDRVYARASSGVDDVARIVGSAGNDLFRAWSDRQALRGIKFYTDVGGFDRTYVNPLSGVRDLAFLNDSPSDDFLLKQADRTFWGNGQYRIEMRNFDRVDVSSTRGGMDVAWLQVDQPAAQFVGQARTAALVEAGTRHDLHGFRRVTLNDQSEPVDAVYLSAVDYVFEQLGNSGNAGVR